MFSKARSYITRKTGHRNSIAFLFIAVIVIAAAITVSFFLTKPERTTTNTIKEEEALKQAPNTVSASSWETAMITKTRIVPDKMTIEKGTGVSFVNFSGKNMEIVSDDPAASAPGLIAAGGGISLKFDTPGNYTFHSAADPKRQITITVK